MKKIMFNDHYGLTRAVLEGRKTQTRRKVTLTLHEISGENKLKEVYAEEIFLYEGAWLFKYKGKIYELPKENRPKYKVGEIVAIAQSYLQIASELEDPQNAPHKKHFEKNVDMASWYCCADHPGFKNKMFVSPEEMPHQIRITNVRVEELQNISDDDCEKEGIERRIYRHPPEDWVVTCPAKRFVFKGKNFGYGTGVNEYCYKHFHTGQKAFAFLIDKISGKGTWGDNPYVFVYDFELVK